MRVSYDLRWPHVIAFVALLAGMAAATYLTQPTSSFAWARPAVFPVFFLGIMALNYHARRLVAAQT